MNKKKKTGEKNRKEQCVPCCVNKSIAQEYAELCVICDRKGIPLVTLDDYIERYCS